MLLLKIRDYIKSKKIVTMVDITYQFNLPHEQARLYTQKLLDKNIIKRIDNENICCKNFQGCGNCVKLMYEIYEYSKN